MIRILGFRTDYRPGKQPVDMVHFTSSDAINETGVPTHSTWERISAIIPPDFVRNDDDGLKAAALRSQWAQIEPAYTAWKSNQELPEHGTPLSVWPGVNEDQAAVLRNVNLRTVEEVANAPETLLARPPLPNMRELTRQAALFLEGRSTAEMAARLAALEAQNEMLVAMMAENETEADKPKRGRPRKEVAEAEEAA